MGIVEKLVSSYGFVKCLNREGRLFFHYSSYQNSQNELKLGDLVEFEESIDKRNGKLIAVNLVRHERPASATNVNSNLFQQQQVNIDSSINLMNLKELLLKNPNINSNGNNSDLSSTNGGGGGSGSNGTTTPTSSNQIYNQQQNSYQYLMNGLKMLNIQQSMATQANSNANGQYGSASFNNESPSPSPSSSSSSSSAAVNNLNSIMSLFNKDVNSKNNQQTAINSNLLNMAKAAVAAQSASAALANPSNPSINNGMSEMKKSEMLGNELMEGIIAIAAIKRPIINNNLYVSFFLFFRRKLNYFKNFLNSQENMYLVAIVRLWLYLSFYLSYR